MDALLVRLRREQNEIESLSLPADVEIYDDLLPEYIAARKDLESSLAALNRGMADLAAALEGKRERAFEVVALPEVQLFSGCLGLDRVKQVISAHNSAGEQLSARAESARSALEQDLVAGSLEEYEGLCAAVEAAEADVQAASERKEELGSAISMLERELVEHRQPADELNADLRAYLGHEELRLAVEDTGYVLVRKAGRVGVLSEGEKTAIALLYFLKSLRDHRFALDGGVVVLDDPVSSLDANALFLAFGFIRHRVADAAQVFILTHNFAFFRQVRGWFARVKGQGKSSLSDRPSRFFMIECALADGARRSRLCRLDPLLERYESEYHYLFALVYRSAMGAGAGALEANYTLPNVARRLLEAFLAFRRPALGGDLTTKLEQVDFDEARRLRLLRFLHVHSHADAVRDAGHDLYRLSEAKAVLGDLLALLESEDGAHFEAMAGLVTSGSEDTGQS